MAKAARLPSTSAIIVAQAATFTEVHRASFGPSASQAARHQSSVSPCGGQDSDVALLKLSTATTINGRYRNPRPSQVTIRNVHRESADRFTASQALEGAEALHRDEVDDNDQQRPQRERGGERLVGSQERALDQVADEPDLPLGDDFRDDVVAEREREREHRPGGDGGDEEWNDHRPERPSWSGTQVRTRLEQPRRKSLHPG